MNLNLAKILPLSLKETCNLKRESRDVDAGILAEVLKGAGKTRILYRCNLSHRQLTRHLSFLLEKGFLEVVVNPSTRYRTTDEGREGLKRYKNLTELERGREFTDEKLVGLLKRGD